MGMSNAAYHELNNNNMLIAGVIEIRSAWTGEATQRQCWLAWLSSTTGHVLLLANVAVSRRVGLLQTTF